MTTQTLETAPPPSSAAQPEATRNRFLGRVRGRRPGNTLVVVAGLHGNEPAGVRALERLLPKLAEIPDLLAGEVIGLAGNLGGLSAGRRFVTHDLNRIWSQTRLVEVEHGRRPAVAEDGEMAELARALHSTLADARGQVFLLDLHTTSAPSPAFLVLDDRLDNRAFGLALPVPVVLGLEEELEGTMLNYVTQLGATGIGFESGQHEDPRSIDRAVAAIWICLGTAGLVSVEEQAEVRRARRFLAGESHAFPHVVEVRHRHPVRSGSGFRMRPGFVSFQPVRRGTRLAEETEGAVEATLRGLLLMPLYQPQGDDGFFITRPVSSFWLELSALLRQRHFERFAHLLPGVRRHPELPGAFIVDLRIARWYAVQIFHLLGFRRRSVQGHELVVIPRHQDVTRA